MGFEGSVPGSFHWADCFLPQLRVVVWSMVVGLIRRRGLGGLRRLHTQTGIWCFLIGCWAQSFKSHRRRLKERRRKRRLLVPVGLVHINSLWIELWRHNLVLLMYQAIVERWLILEVLWEPHQGHHPLRVERYGRRVVLDVTKLLVSNDLQAIEIDKREAIYGCRLMPVRWHQSLVMAHLNSTFLKPSL